MYLQSFLSVKLEKKNKGFDKIQLLIDPKCRPVRYLTYIFSIIYFILIHNNYYNNK